MYQKKVIVKISPLGKVKVDAEGFNGVSCEAATMPIEQALAPGAPMEREFKPEWANAPQTEEVEQIRQW